MSSMTVPYKEHLIDPRAHELKIGSGFSAEVYVFDCRTNTDTRFLFQPHVFTTREAALAAAVQAGRLVIDKGYDPDLNPFAR